MTSVNIVDETWFAVPARVLTAVFNHPPDWPRMWPDLRLEIVTERGVQGMRWGVTGALRGSMEVWLEAVDPDGEPGTVLHYFLRADIPGPYGTARPLSARRCAAEATRRTRAHKRLALTLKRNLEAPRDPGEPPGLTCSGDLRCAPKMAR